MPVTVIGIALLAAATDAQAQQTPADPPPPVQTVPAAEPEAPPAPPQDAVLPVVEPIVTDEEFNQTVPPLDAADDPELDRPLESIAEFERSQQAEAEAAANQTGTPTPDTVQIPALADGDAVETIGDAPITDQELARPLPPLDSFSVEPVQFAEDAEDDKAVELAYTVTINGLDKIDATVDTDIAGVFKELSTLEDSDGKVENAAMLAARVAEDSALMQRILASEGYYDAVVSTHVDRAETANGQPLNAVVDVVPGRRFTFSSVTVDADPVVPADLITRNLALAAGQPIIAARVQGAEANVALMLPQNGYPFVEVAQRDILLDSTTADGAYTLPVTVGPRARFGGFETTGDLAFDVDHAALLARFKRGDLYDSRQVDDLRQALVATGLFSTISVEPQQTGERADAESEYVTMLVRQDAGPARTLAATGGYSTGQGFRLEGSWTHRNLFPSEGALIARGIGGTQEQGLGASFRRSNAGRRDRTVDLSIDALHSSYDAFEAFTGRIGGQVSYQSTPIWQKKLSYAYGFELIGTSEDAYDFAAGGRTRRTYYIAGLNGELGIDRSDSLLNPTKGFRVKTLLQPEGSLSGGFSPYFRGQIDASGYYPVGDSIVLAGRLRVASILGVARDDLAPSRRIYAGGGGSVRGFGYQQLGPRDPNNDPIGGRSVNEAAAEVRYRFGNFGVVGFVDAGQVYEKSQPGFSNIRLGAGVGGRFYTNFGPLRFDVATPIARKPGESLVSVYISIGQAF